MDKVESKYTFSKIVFRCLFYLFFTLPFVSHTTFASFDLSVMWEEALSHYKNGNYSKASRLFSRWIDLSAEQKIYSPEAYFNLALSQGAEEKIASSTRNFLLSATLDHSLFHFIQIKRTLSRLQKKLGILDPVTEDASFQLFLFFPKNIILILYVIGFWMLVGVLVFWKYKRKGLSLPSTVCLFIFPISIIFLGVLLSFNHYFYGNFGVLSNLDSTVPVYQNPKIDDLPTIVELPSGTIVSFVEMKDSFVKIDGPLVGWITKKHLTQLSR